MLFEVRWADNGDVLSSWLLGPVDKSGLRAIVYKRGRIGNHLHGQAVRLMNRNKNGVDRRRFKRIAFTVSDEIAGWVLLPNDTEVLLKIADIGAGGLRFIPQRNEAEGIKPGAQLILTRIQGYTRLKFLSRLKLIVRWIIDESQFAHVMIGCEFVNISEKQRHQIDLFVAAEARNLKKNI